MIDVHLILTLGICADYILRSYRYIYILVELTGVFVVVLCIESISILLIIYFYKNFYLAMKCNATS